MRFEHEFTVQAPLQRVWEALLDVEQVAPCMPGAEVLERLGEDAYRVAVKVRLGPISLLYRGQVEIASRNQAAHSATLRARAQDARGQGTASATVEMRLQEAPGAQTRAHLQTELQLSGRAAAMGSGVIGDVSEQLIGEFARNLQAMLAPSGTDTAPPPSASVAASGTAPPPATSSAAAQHAGGGASLSAARIVRGVIASRLGDPRALLGAGVVLLLAGTACGYALDASVTVIAVGDALLLAGTACGYALGRASSRPRRRPAR